MVLRPGPCRTGSILGQDAAGPSLGRGLDTAGASLGLGLDTVGSSLMSVLWGLGLGPDTVGLSIEPSLFLRTN